jgi:uncharacterized protein with PIN domain
MKFICDDNLGKLAKYLRILGLDTAFDEITDDTALLRIASSEHRFILSRDHKLTSRTVPDGIMILEHDDPLDQLSDVIKSLKLKIDPDALFNRCSRCNELCRLVDKQEIGQEVFPFILKTHDVIKQCPSCNRFYWKGSHYKALLRRLGSIIPAENLSGDWPEP